MDYEKLLKSVMYSKGEKLPKKHGAWYKIKGYNDNYLVLDSLNGQIYHYPNGAEPSSTNNMYRVVYVFYDKNGKTENYKTVKGHMNNFWYGHLGLRL